MLLIATAFCLGCLVGWVWDAYRLKRSGDREMERLVAEDLKRLHDRLKDVP